MAEHNSHGAHDERTFEEEIKVSGEQLVETVKRLVHETNIRRITIKNEKGETILEIPLSVASVGALLVPVIAALGAVAALVTNCTIVVEKRK